MDVDVVTDARPVRRLPVVAVDGQRRPQPCGDLERDREEMGLGLVTLAELTLGVSARRVEVAKRRERQAVGRVIVGEDRLDDRLRPSVRVRRPQRVTLDDRLVSGSPYTAADDENTKRETPLARMASSSDSVVTTLWW